MDDGLPELEKILGRQYASGGIFRGTLPSHFEKSYEY
tara:strand:+ start:332 stop:442 length:111 start_codon:yes stop_codon:yes gene_type:complete